MESASVIPTAQEIADLVVKRLIEGGGIKDLANANLLTIDEQQDRTDAYTSASIPDQQHGQSDDAPANGWEDRVAVIQCDGGRVQVRDELWGNDKPAVEDPTPSVPDRLAWPDRGGLVVVFGLA